eukprot:2972585-Amphidinium_carterae.1
MLVVSSGNASDDVNVKAVHMMVGIWVVVAVDQLLIRSWWNVIAAMLTRARCIVGSTWLLVVCSEMFDVAGDGCWIARTGFLVLTDWSIELACDNRPLFLATSRLVVQVARWMWSRWSAQSSYGGMSLVRIALRYKKDMKLRLLGIGPCCQKVDVVAVDVVM